MSPAMLRCRCLIGAVFLVLLGGCVTPGPSPRFYVLTPMAETPSSYSRHSAEPAAERPRMVVIQDIRLPLYLDRPQIVTRDTENRLEWSEIDQWGGVLRDDMMRILALNLGRQLAGDRVVAAPYPVSKPPDCRIEVEIRSFERRPDGRVELLAQWWITRGVDGTHLASSEGRFLGEPVAGDTSYDQLVNAMSLVYGELARGVAGSVRSSLARGK